MKIPLSIAKKLVELQEGNKVPYSRLKHPVVDNMIDNGIISKRLIGRSKVIIYLTDPGAMTAHLFNHYGISEIEKYIQLLENEESSRAEAVEASSDSKSKSVRTFKGFLLTSNKAISCQFRGSDYTVNPEEGTFIFIYDFEHLVPDKDVTIVGIENPEVFRNIHKCVKLFTATDILYVCRYPQTKDLVKWLKMIPNSYLHFGDFDYAGINIYLNEYKKHLNERATFFIPEGVEQLIEAKGNRQNYLQQTLSVDQSTITEPGITILIELIGKHKKGLEQEIYVV